MVEKEERWALVSRAGSGQKDCPDPAGETTLW